MRHRVPLDPVGWTAHAKVERTRAHPLREHGKSIRIEAGPRATPRGIYRVDAWESGFRDQAPVSEWPLEKPLLLEKGDIYRVSCGWQSTAELPLKFPSERCASLAFFYPASDPRGVRGADRAVVVRA